jgi:hypothetical protein
MELLPYSNRTTAELENFQNHILVYAAKRFAFRLENAAVRL